MSVTKLDQHNQGTHVQQCGVGLACRKKGVGCENRDDSIVFEGESCAEADS